MLKKPLKIYENHAIRYILVLFFVISFPLITLGQKRSFRILSYNVENLFDTCHDAHFDDHEFLPQADKKWNSWRYWKKQGDLSRTIAAASGASPVELIALCEVENDTVVRDLAKRTKLYRMGYEYLVTQSRDNRGVDVALLYQPERFRVLKDTALRIPLDKDYGRYTRDIYHISGRLPNADTLDVLVNHWPSRRGGTKTTEDFRFSVASFLRDYADSLMAVRRNPKLVFVGDFNDEYSNRSIREGLGATPENVKIESPYVVLSAKLKGKNGVRGTYKYRGKWNQLDQIIVNRGLLDCSKKVHTSASYCRILTFPFLLETDETHGGVKPRRTYLGPIYKGGVSDHLPLLLEIKW